MCIFCKIIDNEIPCYKVYEDDRFLAFLDISQATLGHTLVIPKKHCPNIMSLDDTDILAVVKKITIGLSNALNVSDFNILNNCGEGAGQTVDHFHIHIIPRYKDDNLVIKFASNSLNKEEFSSLQNKISSYIK